MAIVQDCHRLQVGRRFDDNVGVIPGLLFTYGLVSVLMSINALRRPAPPTHRLPPLWLPAMIVNELAPLFLVSRAVVAAAAVGLGGLEHPLGAVGFWMVIAAELALIPVFLRTRRAVAQVRPLKPVPATSVRERALGGRRFGADIEMIPEVRFHDQLTLELYRRRGNAGPAPTLVFVHGGSWKGGDPNKTTRALIETLALDGWVVVTIRYPLSPEATFPDHLIGVKRSIAWARGDGVEFGIDPDRITICGASAGAHLASLAALTPHIADLQPGFEHANTSVAACVGLYGVYDFLNRNRIRFDWPLIPRDVMKATPTEAPELYALASPIDQVTESAPPFLIVHGTHDSLVPPEEGRIMVDALRRTSRAPVEAFESIGGQHAFDALSSPRTRAVAARVAEFLTAVVTERVDR
jgi:acetyl esterase/lipase